jgi:DNA modification methylase|tara:strand:- start:4123 stop:4995 length:873 start_codon:yes stop_codon:yes gene_type:complete
MSQVIDQHITDDYAIYNGDCIEVLKGMPDNSLHYSISSPPFESLYTYSNSDRDMGNSASSDEFFDHFKFLLKELYRALMPGRMFSMHCMALPTSKARDGFIGLRDFPGEIIRAAQELGFIYHSEVVIWKDPVTAMQRTKAIGLLHKQLKKDSCISRNGIPDKIVTLRKPGDNPERVEHTNESFPVHVWQQYASPVWMDIDPSDTLQFRAARESDDERHICPLQLEPVRRCIDLWSNPGDTVFTPFAGIGTEIFTAVQKGRKGVGAELKTSYYKQAIKNIDAGLLESKGLF